MSRFMNILVHVPKRFKSNLSPSLSQIFKNPPAINSELTINGYVKSVRSLKKVAFVDLSDGSTHQNLMCVLKPHQAENLRTGQSLSLRGNWIKSTGKEQAFEFKVLNDNESVKIIGNVPETYPLQKKLHTLQYLRTLPTLRWRTSYLSSILRFRSFVDFKLNEFFQSRDFVKVNPPIITSSDCEGAGELFQIESRNTELGNEPFFGKNAYLTVSTQLHLEVLAASLGNVWTLSPVFRAESSDTNRHLSEFWMLEAEISYVEDLNQLTRFSEDMIKAVLKDLVEDKNFVASNILKSQRSTEDLNEINQKLINRWKNLYNKKWDTISYDKAVKILKDSRKNFRIPVKYEDGLATEHEKWLAGEYFKGPVFVTDYPKDLKPFYMKTNNDLQTVACFDLLVPDVGEIIGGSLREHNLELLKQETNRREMNSEDIQWYISLRENGSVPHGGFGLGLERLICYLSGADNIRDVVPLPRAYQECEA
ncbi:hypothetical protein WICMUC_002546 [Wickerhamomyces mucosus]|uniref:Asparagine--tRNA ligase, mitochondrial n=1 Tax=Wickerhamomyces mucosus TaxID=1378264 RepID=A0A9P8PQS1_9ASCO|nr:hypothetical protein WICMUC_002546 [Wickerhamomyces mucosus]